MAYFTWKNEYSLDIPGLDQEHQRLVDLINQLYDAMQAGQGRNVVGPLLDELIDYAKNHFAHEERLMSSLQFPGINPHLQEHTAFTTKVLTFQQQFQKGGLGLPVQVSQFLKDWLVQHIQGTDRLYIEHFKQKGIR